VILIFKGLTARRLYKSFGVKGMIQFLLTMVLSIEERVFISAQRLSERTVRFVSLSRQFLNGPNPPF
jgi:hypothetical protein